jgi:hypothetical protein
MLAWKSWGDARSTSAVRAEPEQQNCTPESGRGIEGLWGCCGDFPSRTGLRTACSRDHTCFLGEGPQSSLAGSAGRRVSVCASCKGGRVDRGGVLVSRKNMQRKAPACRAAGLAKGRQALPRTAHRPPAPRRQTGRQGLSVQSFNFRWQGGRVGVALIFNSREPPRLAASASSTG